MKMELSIFDSKSERNSFIKLVKKNDIKVKMYCSDTNYSFIEFVGIEKELDKITLLESTF